MLFAFRFQSHPGVPSYTVKYEHQKKYEQNMSIRKAAAPEDRAAAHKREEKDTKLTQQILNLLEQGWSYRALSAELSVPIGA